MSLRVEPTAHGHLVPRVRMCGATSTLSIPRHDVHWDFTDMNTESAPSPDLANGGGGSSSSRSSSSNHHLNFSKYIKQDVKTYKGRRKSLQHGLSAVKHRMLKSTP